MTQKNFLYLLTILMVAILSMEFVACSSSDDDSESSNPLVGTWRAEVKEKGERQYWEMTYNKDFTINIKESNVDDGKIHRQESGLYKVEGRQLTIYWSYKTISSYFTITDGNKLQFAEFDHGIIYYKIK